MEQNIININKKTNRTWLLVALLVVLIVVPLVMFLVSRGIGPVNKDNLVGQKETAHTSLSVSEDVRKSETGTYEADITINTNGDQISGAQIELAFEPTQISNVDITPGDFLSSPTVLTKTIDSTNGVIKYIIAIKPGEEMAEGTGTIATLKFTKTNEEPTNISFLPTSQVSSTGLNESILKETISAEIN